MWLLHLKIGSSLSMAGNLYWQIQLSLFLWIFVIISLCNYNDSCYVYNYDCRRQSLCLRDHFNIIMCSSFNVCRCNACDSYIFDCHKSNHKIILRRLLESSSRQSSSKSILSKKYSQNIIFKTSKRVKV
jgi:hypothetical protein